MHNKCVVFGFLMLLSVVQFKITLGLIEQESYEIFHEYGENKEILKSARFSSIARRDTRNKEPTNRPGVETEPRPPFPIEPFAKHTPTVTPTTHSSSKHIVERIAGTRVPGVTTPAASTPTTNHIVNDNHRYYRSSYDSSGLTRWWYPLDKGEIPAVLHEQLTKNEQYSDTIRTSFQFPYYGHLIDYVTITNKGYIFLGDIVNKFNASSQYVAPLMADFTTHNETTIAYVDTGDRFTVEWTNLRFQNQKLGEFSFQCTILKNGTLIFAYRNIPAPVVELKSNSFQQRVGISDSLRYRILRHGLFIVRGRVYTTIAHNYYFKYHSVDLPMENVKSGSAYVITPLPNCVMLKSCNACVSTPTAFSCAWCPEIQRCSDGIDRYRQQWFMYGCPTNNQTTCPAEPSTTTITQGNNDSTTQSPKHMNKTSTKASEGQTKRNETTDSQGKSSESTEAPTTKIANKTEIITKKLEDNHTMPTKQSPKTIHNATTKVTVISSPDKDNVPSITQNPSSRTVTTKKNKAPLNILGNRNARSGSRTSDVSGVGIGLIVVCLVIILAALCWFVYAYRHPQTRSGRFLIEHRNPKKWFKNSDGTSGGRMHYKTKTMELNES